MPTEQILAALDLLLPGFISTTILYALTPSKTKNNIAELVDAFIFITVISTLSKWTYSALPLSNGSSTSNCILKSFENIFPFLLSAILPCLVAASIKHDIHMKVFRTLKLTDRTSRISTWHDVFTDHKRHIIINFKNGKRLQGWPEYFSDNTEEKLVFVCKAKWIHGDFEESVNNRGILVNPSEVETIEFLETEEK